MGRPRRDPNEPATLRAVAWIVPSDQALMVELARLRRCSVSTLLRELVLEEGARVRPRVTGDSNGGPPGATLTRARQRSAERE